MNPADLRSDLGELSRHVITGIKPSLESTLDQRHSCVKLTKVKGITTFLIRCFFVDYFSVAGTLISCCNFQISATGRQSYTTALQRLLINLARTIPIETNLCQLCDPLLRDVSLSLCLAKIMLETLNSRPLCERRGARFHRYIESAERVLVFLQFFKVSIPRCVTFSREIRIWGESPVKSNFIKFFNPFIA